MYDELYDVWKKEKECLELQFSSRDFYGRLADYVSRVREETRMIDQKTLRGHLLLQELENLKRMIKDLVKLRCQKAMKLTLIGRSIPKDAPNGEEKIYERMLSFSEFYRDFLNGLLRGNQTEILPQLKGREGKPSRLLVRFLQEIPIIIGSDMKEYGPFRPQDIATLPAENARILIEQSAAVEIKIKDK
jgi:DNA replication factor GINS